jgi:hypothetical protein
MTTDFYLTKLLRLRQLRHKDYPCRIGIATGLSTIRDQDVTTVTSRRQQPQAIARDFSRAKAMLCASGLFLTLALMLALNALGLGGLRLISP